MNDDETRKKMSAFAKTFHSMLNRPGVEPWDAEKIDTWGSGPRSHGQQITARFLLSVWDPSAEWKSGPFDLTEALRVWDTEHHKVFLRWVAEPWWPY